MDTPKIIDKKYHIVKHLGAGGFSDVYLVDGPQGECALKLLKGEIVSTKADAIEKFKHEFEILKDMRHPHIAAILDFGFDAENGSYYYTSEFIDGPDLFKATVDLQPEETTDLIVQALRALEYLHSYRVHHFDIKTANILVLIEDKFTVKIIDFGLAGIDPRGRQIGTPSYMPPEIIERAPADGRADLYSLGVLWFMALTRLNPFRGADTQKTLERQLHLKPPPPSALEPGIPKWMDAVILRLLEKNPSNRFQNAESVIREINRTGPKKYKMETRETLLSYLPDEGRFIGRERECKAVEDAVSNISKIGGLAQCWLISGGAGAGKSRFIKEMKYRLQLKEIHVRLAAVEDNEMFSEWCEKLGSHLADGKGMEVFLLDNAQKLSGDESKAAKIMSLMARAKRPCSGTSALIALAVSEADRGDFFSSLAETFHGQISMGPFTNEELKEYLTSLTGLENPPDNLSDGIMRRTEGNPLFVTEVIRSLIARGGLFDEHGRWKEGLFEDVGVDFSKVIVSPTIGDLLIERTKSLSEDEKKILEFLAAAKKPASSIELGIWTGIESPHILVLELIRIGILEKIGAFEIQFQNTLMGEIIYERINPEKRRQMHDKIAGALKTACAPDDQVLEHTSRGTDAHAAIHASISLGDKALKAGLGKTAAEYFERALSLIKPDDAEHMIEVKMKLGEAHLIGHNYAEAKNQFTAVEESMSHGDIAAEAAKWRTDTLMRLGGTFVKLQEFERAKSVFEEARKAMLAAGGDRRREIVIENFLAGIFFQDGKLKEAREIFERTRTESLNLPADDQAKITNNDLGVLLLFTKDIDGAEKIFDEDLKVAVQHGDDLLIGRARYNLAQLATAKRNFPLAIESYEHCAEVCRHSNNIELLLRAYNGMGNTYQLAGRPDLSIKNYERGLELHERIGDMRGGAAIAVNMGIVETSRGNLEAALDRIVPAVEYLRGLPQKTAADLAVLARGLLELGDVLCRKEKYDEAMVRLSEAEEISLNVHHALPMRFWIIVTKAEVAAAKGDREKLAGFVALLKPLASDDAERNAIAKLEKSLPAGEKMTESKPKDELRLQYKKILAINKLIAGEGDLNYILKTVLHYALELSGAEAGAILLLDKAGKISVSEGLNMQTGGDEAKFSRSLARRAIETETFVLTDNAMTDSRFSGEESVCINNLRSILCLPVKAKGKVVGAIYLDHRYKEKAFAGIEFSVLEAFADQVGLAIETSRTITAQIKKEESLQNDLMEASRRAEKYKSIIEERTTEPALDYGIMSARSPAMRKVLRTIDKIADTDLSVFLCGETGTGKELMARSIHSNHSSRKKNKFVAINCGAIPTTLIESELFGYKAGAFTGAVRDKRGFIEEAKGGTLFLDEVGEIGKELQVKLLRVLQEKECTRVGATEPYSADVRVIAASNRDIEEMVKEEAFREDFFYRLCQIKIVIPPLRERPEDIVVLSQKFIKDAAPDKTLSVSPSLMRRFMSYGWPGNIRELQNLIQVACALADGNVLDERAIPENHPIMRSAPRTETFAIAKNIEPHALKPAGTARIDEFNEYDANKSWKDCERLIIAKCYEANGMNARATAAELKISLTTMYKRIAEWNLDDTASETYKETFKYTRGRTLDEYLPLVFRAALVSESNKPTLAIANLKISQGYFYKVMKKNRS